MAEKASKAEQVAVNTVELSTLKEDVREIKGEIRGMGKAVRELKDATVEATNHLNTRVILLEEDNKQKGKFRWWLIGVLGSIGVGLLFMVIKNGIFS